MKPQRAADGERILAVFIDFENLALGFGNRRDKFSIEKVLERLVEKGKIVAKKAYADWSRFGNYAASLHASAVELVEIPKRTQTGKNSADIRMCVDAMDLAYSKDHIDTFVVVSGDSDFSPLVSKLKELGKHLIGLGLADSTSDLLRDNCDEFIYYEDLDRVAAAPVVQASGIPESKQKAFTLVLDTLHALRRENKELILPSMVKDTIKRKKPSFNEDYYGYRTFSELLEDAQREGLLELDKHRTSGMYVVTRFGLEMKAGALPPVSRVIPLPKGGEGRKPIELVPRNGNGAPVPEPKKALELPPRGGPELRRAEPPQRPEQPQRAEPQRPEPEPRKVEPPKPAAAAPKPAAVPRPVPARPVPPAPAPARSASPPKPPAPKREDADDDRPLGRALVDDFDDLDDEPLDEVPTYAPRKAEVKPAAVPARPAPAKPTPITKPVAAKEPAPAKPASKPVATPEPVSAKPGLAKPAPAKAPARPVSEGNEPDAPPAKPAAKPKPATKVAGPKPAAKPPAKEPPVRPRQPDPKPPSDDDEFGAGL